MVEKILKISLVLFWPGILVMFYDITAYDKEVVMTLLVCVFGFLTFLGGIAFLIHLRDGDLPGDHSSFPFTSREPTGEPVDGQMIVTGAVICFLYIVCIMGLRIYQDKFFLPSQHELHDLITIPFQKGYTAQIQH